MKKQFTLTISVIFLCVLTVSVFGAAKKGKKKKGPKKPNLTKQKIIKLSKKMCKVLPKIVDHNSKNETVESWKKEQRLWDERESALKKIKYEINKEEKEKLAWEKLYKKREKQRKKESKYMRSISDKIKKNGSKFSLKQKKEFKEIKTKHKKWRTDAAENKIKYPAWDIAYKKWADERKLWLKEYEIWGDNYKNWLQKQKDKRNAFLNSRSDDLIMIEHKNIEIGFSLIGGKIAWLSYKDKPSLFLEDNTLWKDKDKNQYNGMGIVMPILENNTLTLEKNEFVNGTYKLKEQTSTKIVLESPVSKETNLQITKKFIFKNPEEITCEYILVAPKKIKLALTSFSSFDNDTSTAYVKTKERQIVPNIILGNENAKIPFSVSDGIFRFSPEKLYSISGNGLASNASFTHDGVIIITNNLYAIKKELEIVSKPRAHKKISSTFISLKVGKDIKNKLVTSITGRLKDLLKGETLTLKEKIIIKHNTAANHSKRFVFVKSLLK